MTTTVEAKYPYLIARNEHLRHAIETACMRDGRYAEDDIHSIYFDTPTRLLLSQKESSDYQKTKIRLRWYGSSLLAGNGANIPAFMERKSKQGIFRHKPRIRVSVPANLLHEGKEDLDGIARIVAGALCELAPDLPALFPMIVIRYRRARFVDPFAAARLSLDGRIRFSAVNTRFFPRSSARMLVNGVLEVKSADGSLSPALMAARYFLFAKDSFSKYQECWQAHDDPLHQRSFRWTHFER